MDKEALKEKLKKTKKRKLREEKQEIVNQQEILHTKRREYEQNKDLLVKTLMAAVEAKNDSAVDVAKIQIEIIQKEIEKIDSKIKENATVLKLYTEALKNDREGKASRDNSIAGWVIGLGGLGLGALGTALAYNSDEDGSPVRKNVLSSARDVIGNVIRRH